jgi:hypothetical protein
MNDRMPSVFSLEQASPEASGRYWDSWRRESQVFPAQAEASGGWRSSVLVPVCLYCDYHSLAIALGMASLKVELNCRAAEKT